MDGNAQESKAGKLTISCCMTALEELWSIKNHDSEDDHTSNCVDSVTVFPQIKGYLGKLDDEGGDGVKTHDFVFWYLYCIGFRFCSVDLNIVRKVSEEQCFQFVDFYHLVRIQKFKALCIRFVL